MDIDIDYFLIEQDVYLDIIYNNPLTFKYLYLYLYIVWITSALTIGGVPVTDKVGPADGWTH